MFNQAIYFRTRLDQQPNFQYTNTIIYRPSYHPDVICLICPEKPRIKGDSCGSHFKRKHNLLRSELIEKTHCKRVNEDDTTINERFIGSSQF